MRYLAHLITGACVGVEATDDSVELLITEAATGYGWLVTDDGGAVNMRHVALLERVPEDETPPTPEEGDMLGQLSAALAARMRQWAVPSLPERLGRERWTGNQRFGRLPIPEQREETKPDPGDPDGP